MKFKIFAVFLLLIICFTFIVPLASAETVTEGGAQFTFHALHGSYVTGPGDRTNYIDKSNDFFTVSYYNTLNINDFYFTNLGNIEYDFSMNGSPVYTFSGHYSLFTPRFFGDVTLSISPNMEYYFDGLLHSYALIFAVPINFPYDVQDDFISFTNVDFWDDSHLTKLQTSFTEVADGLVNFQINGSYTSLGDVPSFSFFFQEAYSSNVVSTFQAFEFYCLTWYHTPTYYDMRFNVTPTGLNDMFFIFSLIDMTSINTGYETGYREGVLDGKEQANNTVNTGSASYNAGFEYGYDEGIEYANNTLNSGSVSYQTGFEDGYDEGTDYANTHVNESSASYIQGKYDGVESANKYTFLGLISAIIDAPIRAVFGYTTVENGVEVQHGGLLTFEVFGVDMSNFVLSIFSIAVVLCIIRIIRGG